MLMTVTNRDFLSAIQLQVWTGPMGSRRLRFPEFLDSRHMKVVSLSAVNTGCLYLQEIFVVLIFVRAGISPVSIATRYGLDGPGIVSRGGEIFRTRPDRPWGPPSLLYNEYRVFPGGKAAGAWRWPPTPSSDEIKERVELYLYSPSGPLWLARVNFTFTFTHFC